MSAREVMAKRVSDVWGPTLGQAIPTAVMAALIEAGYRILAPGEVDAETVERCATVLDKGVYASKHDVELAWELAGLIRTLGRRA